MSNVNQLLSVGYTVRSKQMPVHITDFEVLEGAPRPSKLDDPFLYMIRHTISWVYWLPKSIRRRETPISSEFSAKRPFSKSIHRTVRPLKFLKREDGSEFGRTPSLHR